MLKFGSSSDKTLELNFDLEVLKELRVRLSEKKDDVSLQKSFYQGVSIEEFPDVSSNSNRESPAEMLGS